MFRTRSRSSAASSHDFYSRNNEDITRNRSDYTSLNTFLDRLLSPATFRHKQSILARSKESTSDFFPVENHKLIPINEAQFFLSLMIAVSSSSSH